MKLTWRNTLTMMMVTCLIFTLYACSNNSSGNKGDIADQAGSEPANGTNASTAKAAASAENPSDLTGEMTMWGWDNEHFKVYMAAFNKAYPNVKVNYVPVESSEYANKVRVGLSTNTEFPDVVTIEESFIPQFINLGVFEDLSAAPYNMDTSKFPGFLVDRYTDDTGYLGPPDSTSPAAMYYRRDLAKKYLGTDDPEEVGKLIGAGEASWDKFLAVGEKLKADSNGEVFLIPGLGDMINVLKKQPKSDWRDGNTLTVKENYLPHFQMLKDIRDKGLDAKTEQWSAAWNAMYANGNVLFFPGASWYVGFVVGLNDKDGNGRWGITGTPVANWAWGGSGLTIPKASKNKEAALAWITWWYSMEGAKTMYDAIGSLPAQPEFLEDPFFNQPEEILGGMKLGEFWKDKYDGIYSRKVTADDAVFEEGLVLAVNAIGTGSKTPEQAVEDLAKEIKGRVPGLK